MFKIIVKTLLLSSMVVIAGCSSTPSSSSGPRPPLSGGAPDWVKDQYAGLSDKTYVAATGTGSSQDQADKQALAGLAAYFGQSIQADLQMVERYSEAVNNGIVTFSDNTDVQNVIKTSAQMDTLIGAEVRDRWDDKKTYYARAVLERAKSMTLYNEMIQSNQKIITGLITLSDAEKFTFDGYARFHLAATISDVNRIYGQVLTALGMPAALQGGDGKKADDFRTEAMNIAKTIPVAIQLDADRTIDQAKANRIQTAFAKVLENHGFRSGGNTSRYVIRVKLTLETTDHPNQNKFVRYVIDANFVDTVDNSVLIPFNINGREGHATVSEAENRAIAGAEKKIATDYDAALTDYMEKLMPKK